MVEKTFTHALLPARRSLFLGEPTGEETTAPLLQESNLEIRESTLTRSRNNRLEGPDIHEPAHLAHSLNPALDNHLPAPKEATKCKRHSHRVGALAPKETVLQSPDNRKEPK
jgi:hypothetical protein